VSLCRRFERSATNSPTLRGGRSSAFPIVQLSLRADRSLYLSHLFFLQTSSLTLLSARSVFCGVGSQSFVRLFMTSFPASVFFFPCPRAPVRAAACRCSVAHELLLMFSLPPSCLCRLPVSMCRPGGHANPEVFFSLSSLLSFSVEYHDLTDLSSSSPQTSVSLLPYLLVVLPACACAVVFVVRFLDLFDCFRVLLLM